MSGLEDGFNGLFYYFIYWDMLIKALMQEIQRPWLVEGMQIITQMGSPLMFMVLNTLLTTYLIREAKGDKKNIKKSKKRIVPRAGLEAIFLNGSLFSSWALMEFMKNLFERSRPFGEALTASSGFSFPSGHAMLSMAFYGFIAYLVISYTKNKWGYLGATALYLLVLMIGFSRVYLNVHYASDVLAGFLLGLICLAVNIKGLNMTRRRLRDG